MDNGRLPKKRRLLTYDEEEEIKLRINLLLVDGRKIEGTSPTVDINVRPDFFDEERFNRAQKVVNKYYSNVSISSLIGLILLLQFDEIVIPLLKTGKSRTVKDLFDRYTATIKYIRKCYETRFYDSSSEGWQYVNLVRSMHKRTFKLLNTHPQCNALTKYIDNEIVDYVWINQYDMALTQFAFVGLFILNPKKCGAYGITDSELSDVVYYWRLISYQFGLENTFNLFVYDQDISMEYRLLQLLLEHYNEKLSLNRNLIGIEMGRGLMLAFKDFAKETTYNILEHHWKDMVSLSGKKELDPIVNLGEKYKLIRFNLIFKCLFRSSIAASYLNVMYKKKFDNFCKKGDRIKKKLTKKYPNHSYELDAT